MGLFLGDNGAVVIDGWVVVVFVTVVLAEETVGTTAVLAVVVLMLGVVEVWGAVDFRKMFVKICEFNRGSVNCVVLLLWSTKYTYNTDWFKHKRRIMC